jgi:hypothetical protein
MRQGSRVIGRRTFLAGSAALVLPACAGRRDRPAVDVDALADRIGTSDRADAIATVRDLRSRGVPMGALFAAAWLAPIRWGGLPSDVHAVLCLPSVARAAEVAQSIGVEPWPIIEWAIGNANAWCQRTRASAARIRSPFEAELAQLARQAMEPHEDPHVTIYAAQLARASDAWPALRRAEVVAHLGQYLARARRRDPLEAAMEGETIDTLVSRASAISDDPHPLTHLDALVYLSRRYGSATPLARAVHPRLRTAAREAARTDPPVQTREASCRALVRTGRDEHAFKRWAAADALNAPQG